MHTSTPVQIQPIKSHVLEAVGVVLFLFKELFVRPGLSFDTQRAVGGSMRGMSTNQPDRTLHAHPLTPPSFCYHFCMLNHCCGSLSRVISHHIITCLRLGSVVKYCGFPYLIGLWVLILPSPPLLLVLLSLPWPRCILRCKEMTLRVR